MAEEVARRDVSDIRFLRENPAFNNYWLRRLKQKREIVAERFRYGPIKEVGHEEREILRRILDEYDELMQMMTKDEAMAQRHISSVGIVVEPGRAPTK